MTSPSLLCLFILSVHEAEEDGRLECVCERLCLGHSSPGSVWRLTSICARVRSLQSSWSVQTRQPGRNQESVQETRKGMVSIQCRDHCGDRAQTLLHALNKNLLAVNKVFSFDS